jgi:peptidoglycan/LPS O-acetylase OafA/YrhL
LLETPPLVYFGRISYGFNLLHMPVVVYLRTHWPLADGSVVDCLRLFGTTLLVSTVLATVSWWFRFERPMLRLRRSSPLAPTEGSHEAHA